jgi:hypothetical protein
MKQRKINVPIFLAWLITICFLMFFSFLASMANDEGHATTTTLLFEKLFLILRFPAITIMMPFLNEGRAVPYLLFMGLFLNAILYAFLAERCCAWIFVRMGITSSTEKIEPLHSAKGRQKRPTKSR